MRVKVNLCVCSVLERENNVGTFYFAGLWGGYLRKEREK